MDSITIKGVEYKVRFISLFQFQKCLGHADRYSNAERTWLEKMDDESEKAYKDSWLKYCAAFLEGDVSGLSIDKIEPKEAGELGAFFYDVLADKAPGQKKSPQTSEGLEATKDNPETNSR